MSKRLPFNKRTIEAIPTHDPDSKNQEAEYSDAERIGLKLRDLNQTFRGVGKKQHHCVENATHFDLFI